MQLYHLLTLLVMRCDAECILSLHLTGRGLDESYNYPVPATSGISIGIKYQQRGEMG